MPENEPPDAPPAAESSSTSRADSPESTQATTSAAGENANRAEIIARARTFLTSPQIQNQDLFSKRKFLLEKGLHEPEIELLLRELVRQFLERVFSVLTSV